FFFSSRRRHTRSKRDWSSDVCSSDLRLLNPATSLAYCVSIPWLRSSRTWRACSPLPQETMPPSPEVMFLVGYRENIPDCPKVPKIGRASCRERGEIPAVETS